MKKMMSVLMVCMMIAGPAHAGDGHGKMKRIDTDGDGAISKQEMLQFHEKRFEKSDKDGDGVLSREEVKDAMQKRHKRHKKFREHHGE